MKSLAVASIALVAALAGYQPAAAAPCTTVDTCTITGLNGSTTLGVGNPVAIEDENVTPGSYFAEGVFSVAAGLTVVTGNADVAFDAVPPGESQVPAGFSNLVIEFFQDATSLGSFQITDAQGLIPLGADSFMFTLISASDVMFRLTGLSFRNTGAALADYDVNLSAIPLPGALPLLFSGLAGLTFAARSRKRRVTA